MRILIVIGAGASYDCWTKVLSKSALQKQKLPLANDLFSSEYTQNFYLTKYNLVGLAGKLRDKLNLTKNEEKPFDVEFELSEINDRATKINDLNRLQDLFKSKFYLHNLIYDLAKDTLEQTNSHTVYIDLLNQLKDWIDNDQASHFVDIVSFNYDNLLEDAMANVYGYNWTHKNMDNPLRAYTAGNNLKIYKPHGSINWGREISRRYTNPDDLFVDFDQITLNDSFVYITPNNFFGPEEKNYIPAIAVPFKNKDSFEECPSTMQSEMIKAVENADNLITIGWKGTDRNFTDLLKSNGKKINEIHIVSPTGDTYLDEVFQELPLIKLKFGFREFVTETKSLKEFLTNFSY